LTGAKHSALLTNQLDNINKTKHNYNGGQHKNLDNYSRNI